MPKAAGTTKKAAPKSNSDASLRKQVRALREEGTPWPDIAGKLEISQGKAMLLDLESQIRPEDRISGDPDDTSFGKKIVKARDDQLLSWGQLMARTGLPESRLRKIYEDTTGNSTKGNRIGKGGRFPDGEGPAKTNGSKKATKATKGTTKKVAKKAAGAKKTAKKAAASKKSGQPAAAVTALAEMDLDGLRERLSGKTIEVKSQNGGPTRKIGVALVKELRENGDISFTDDKGKARFVQVADITKAGR